MTIVHIGLPKTATTFWQHRIFRNVPEIDFLHRAIGDDEREIAVALRDYCQDRGKPFARGRYSAAAKKLARRVEKADRAGRPVVISDENISVAAKAFWRNSGPPPSEVAERIDVFFRDLGGIYGEVRVLVGVRSQAHWLASRYAQSEIAYAEGDTELVEEFNQADFNRRLSELAGGTALSGSQLWLDYAHVIKKFGAIFGRKNILAVPMEKLADKPRSTMRKVGKFIGHRELVDTYLRQRADLSQNKMMPNRLSTSENTWKLGEGNLHLLPDLKAGLEARFAESNSEIYKKPIPVAGE